MCGLITFNEKINSNITKTYILFYTFNQELMNKLLGGNFDLFSVVPHVSVIPNKNCYIFIMSIYAILGRRLIMLQNCRSKEEGSCYSRTVKGRKKPNVTPELSKEGRSQMLLQNCQLISLQFKLYLLFIISI